MDVHCGENGGSEFPGLGWVLPKLGVEGQHTREVALERCVVIVGDDLESILSKFPRTGSVVMQAPPDVFQPVRVWDFELVLGRPKHGKGSANTRPSQFSELGVCLEKIINGCRLARLQTVAKLVNELGWIGIIRYDRPKFTMLRLCPREDLRNQVLPERIAVRLASAGPENENCWLPNHTAKVGGVCGLCCVGAGRGGIGLNL